MKTRIWIIIGLLSLVITSCDRPKRTAVRPTSPPGPSQTWIDAPQPNSSLHLQPTKLVFHGASFVGVTEFDIKINGYSEATVPPGSTGSGGSQYGTLFYGEYTWDPPATGTYLIEIRAKGNGVFSPPDQVQVTITDSDFGLTDPTPPLKDPQECTYTALINHFCRRGPNNDYEEIDHFAPEQFAPIIGQSTDGLFWYVVGPNYGEVCTIPAEDGFGKLSGDCETLPKFTPLPPPTSNESPGCTVRQAGGEIICVSPCPDGAAPGDPCTP